MIPKTVVWEVALAALRVGGKKNSIPPSRRCVIRTSMPGPGCYDLLSTARAARMDSTSAA
jgi:hypothetical protein